MAVDLSEDLVLGVESLAPAEAAAEYPAFFRAMQRCLPGVSLDRVAAAVSLAAGTCPYCWESPRGCQCWNDE